MVGEGVVVVEGVSTVRYGVVMVRTVGYGTV